MLPADFQANQIKTELTWKDLAVSPETLSEIHEIENWIKNSNVLSERWGLSRKLERGFNALFYGSDGAGKTLTASLLGKYSGKDVYRIDLTKVVSKYIGETEKNLSLIFDKAENKDWILFFDEADALFGKRTEVKDAHDRYANQEISYLLQRCDDYHGLIIAASNFKKNLDETFSRIFKMKIYFPNPDSKEEEKK